MIYLLPLRSDVVAVYATPDRYPVSFDTLPAKQWSFAPPRW